MDGIIYEIVGWLKTRDPTLVFDASVLVDSANIHGHSNRITLWIDMEDGSVTLFKYPNHYTMITSDVEMDIVELNNPNCFENVYCVIDKWLATSQR